MKSVKDEVRNPVLNQVWDQVRNQVEDQVDDQVRIQVEDQIWRNQLLRDANNPGKMPIL